MDDKRTEGHRKRLRERFLQSGLDAFLDYEVVELLLTLGTPRKDCKQQAKDAIEEFKTLRGVLEASPEELQEIRGVGPTHIFVIKFIQELAREFLKEQLLDRPYCRSSREVFDYLYHSMRDLKKEVFKVMFWILRITLSGSKTFSKGPSTPAPSTRVRSFRARSNTMLQR